MATKKFSGRSISMGSVSSVFNKINKTNLRVELADLMATLAERQRASVCLRGQEGVMDSQAAHCGCIFCSPERQRVRFGATFEEMRAIDEEKAREQTRYVRGMLAYERIRHAPRKSVAIRGLR